MEKIKLEVTPEVYNLIQEALSQGAYRVVAPVMADLEKQMIAQKPKNEPEK